MTGESRMEKMRKILSSPLGRKKQPCLKTFGVPLSHLCSRSDADSAADVPFIVHRICSYIEKNALQVEGIFRVPGSTKDVEKLKSAFNKHGDADIEEIGDPYSIASLLKMFLRELPEALVTDAVHQELLLALKDGGELTPALRKLSADQHNLLSYLCAFLTRVSQCQQSNKMSFPALAIVFAPSVFRGDNTVAGLANQGCTNQLMCRLLQQCDQVFSSNKQQITVPKKSGTTPSSPKEIIEKSPKKPVPPLRPPPPALMSADKQPTLLQLSEATVPPPKNGTLSSTPSLQLSTSSARTSTHKKITAAQPHNPPRMSPPHSRPSPPAHQPKMCTGQPPTQPATFQSEERRPCSPQSHSAGSKKQEVPDHHSVKCGSDDSEESGGPSLRKNSVSDMADSLATDTSERSSLIASPVVSPQAAEIVSKAIGATVIQHLFPSFDNDIKLKTTEKCEEEVEGESGPVVLDQADADSGKEESESIANNVNEDSVGSSVGNTPSDGSGNDDIQLFNNNMKKKTEMEDVDISDAEEEEKVVEEVKWDGFLEVIQTPTPEKSPSPTRQTNSRSKNVLPHLDFSKLREYGDEDPQPAELSPWTPALPSTDDEDVIVSPRLSKVSKAKACSDSDLEAHASSPELSSNYLRRRANSDPTVPPSPPERDFLAHRRYSHPQLEEVNVTTIKQLGKRIKSIKRKIRKFEEQFVSQNGYKPSRQDKMAFPNVKRYMHDMTKAKRELKELKGELHMMEHTIYPSPNSELSTSELQFEVDEDSDSHLQAMDDTLQACLENLAGDRLSSERPDELESMSGQQVFDEKVAMQKVLLEFEQKHGRPQSKAEKELVRPIYDRYRNVKRLMSCKVPLQNFPAPNGSPTSTSMSASNSNLAMRATESLEPIMEDKELNASTVLYDVESKIVEMDSPKHTFENGEDQIVGDDLEKNINLHEASVPELLDCQQSAKGKKRHLRKVLKDFEDSFNIRYGRKISKEERSPMHVLYEEYKQTKARLRLIDVLLSKHEPQLL